MQMDVKGIGRLSIDVVGLWTTTLDGAVVTSELARGRVKVRSEERIFSGLPMRAQLGAMRIDEQRSTFTLTRLPARAAGCAMISDASRAAGPRAASRPTSPRP